MPLPRRLIIVVDTDIKDRANTLAKRIDTVGGERTFVTPLYPAGLPQGAPSHYWCSWAMTDLDDINLRALRSALSTLDRTKIRLFNGNIRTPESVLAELNLATAVGRDEG